MLYILDDGKANKVGICFPPVRKLPETKFHENPSVNNECSDFKPPYCLRHIGFGNSKKLTSDSGFTSQKTHGNQIS